MTSPELTNLAKTKEQTPGGTMTREEFDAVMKVDHELNPHNPLTLTYEEYLADDHEQSGSVPRHYQHHYIRTNTKSILELAERNGLKGITAQSLVRKKLARTIKQARRILLRLRANEFLFTIGERHPQVYYSSEKKSNILRRLVALDKSDRSGVDVLTKLEGRRVLNGLEEGVGQLRLLHQKRIGRGNVKSGAMVPESCIQDIVAMIEAGSYPLMIHGLQFKVQLEEIEDSDGKWYADNVYPSIPSHEYNPRSKGKSVSQWLEGYHCTFTFYPGCVLEISCSTSHAPFKVMTHEDRITLNSFLGRLYERIVNLVYFEGTVPPVNNWFCTRLDINYDALAALNMQMFPFKFMWRHLDRAFCIYCKDMEGGNSVVRVEERQAPNKPIVHMVEELFSFSKLQQRVVELEKRMASMENLKLGNAASTVGISISE